MNHRILQVESSSSTKLPPWLESLLSETYFIPCMIHEDAKKNEKNIFCLDCCEAICHHCLDLHTSHRLLQVGIHNSSVLKIKFSQKKKGFNSNYFYRYGDMCIMML